METCVINTHSILTTPLIRTTGMRLPRKNSRPLTEDVIRVRSVKRGIAEYVRTLGIRAVPLGEKVIDTFLRLAGDPVNERFLDRFIDHCWKLTKRDIIRFILVEACIAAGFFILRHALLMQVPGLSFWQIVLHPFIVIAQSL